MVEINGIRVSTIMCLAQPQCLNLMNASCSVILDTILDDKFQNYFPKIKPARKFLVLIAIYMYLTHAALTCHIGISHVVEGVAHGAEYSNISQREPARVKCNESNMCHHYSCKYYLILSQIAKTLNYPSTYTGFL